MTATQGDLASLSRYIFRAPRWYASVAFALVVAAVAGVAAFDSRFVLEDAWQGAFFIGVPTVVASLLTTPVDRWLGGQLTYNRSSLLALTCEVLIVAIMAATAAVSRLAPGLGQKFVFDALIVGLASVFALRLLVVMAVSGTSVVVAAIPASIQTATAAALFFIYSGTMRYLELGGGPLTEILLMRADEAPPELGVIVPVDFALLGIVCGIYGLAVWAFVRLIDRPWQRSLGVSVLDFVSGFIGHIAEGTRELEDFFEAIGEEAVVPVTVLSFRDGDGDEKARFVLPMIHPGPMGEIGGGNLPERVALEADGLAFPPHATAGHDFNLVTEREVDTVMETAREAYERIEYHDTASRSVRVREGDAKVVGQAFDDDALLVATYSPEVADDVEYAVGLSAAAEARSAGVEDVMLVDAHNCNDGLAGPDLGHVYPGSERSFETMQAAGAAGERLAAADQAPVRLGVAWDETDWEPLDGIGPLGVRVAVLDVGGHRTAYVLVDGNNMEPGLRDRIVARLTEDGLAAEQADAAGESAPAEETADTGEEAAARADGAMPPPVDELTQATDDPTPPTADEAEVMTTDTHVVNQVEASNQVGESIDQDELVAVIDRLVAEATADLEPVEAGMATERAEVTVFGNDRTETLASHANAVISMGAALAAAVVLAAMAISLLVFLVAGG